MSRTEAEKLEFAKACERIERHGGDVLDYIRREYPSYTPLPTWYRLQRDYLKRKDLKDGKPHEQTAGKEVKRMKKRDRKADIQTLIDSVKAGKDPWDVITGIGYRSPHSAFHDMKKWARENDQELYEELCSITVHKKKTEAQQQEAETVVFNGKEYEKMEPAEVASPTCCQPARPSGVTVPDELPEEEPAEPNGLEKASDAMEHIGRAASEALQQITEIEEPLETLAVRSRVKGYYQITDVRNEMSEDRYVHLIWLDLVTREERSIGMSASDWLRLAKEIPVALKQLGV